MLKRFLVLGSLVFALGTLASAQAARPAAPGNNAHGKRIALGDWPEARGPHGVGRSDEKGLIDKWAMNGDNFLWRAPYGVRSAPGVMGDRGYPAKTPGLRENKHESVMGR